MSGFPIAARPLMGNQKVLDDTAAIGCPVAAPTQPPNGRRIFQGREEPRTPAPPNPHRHPHPKK
ncbi:hypothetical protein GCM10010306_013720 [Streptomyces umbrinus]|nr:hypothetical protein GCM10010306_013720 [Streptomyces umbrinus]